MINKFIDSKYGLEVMFAIIVYVFVLLMVKEYAPIVNGNPFSAEARKNIAGMMAVLFMGIVELQRYRGVNI